MSEHYTTPPKPRRRIPIWVWVVGGLLIGSALLGSCVMGGVKVFKSLDGRAQASEDIAEKILKNSKLPSSSDPIWVSAISGQEGFDEQTTKMSKLYAKFGEVKHIGEATCGMNSYTGTQQENGTFATCTMSFEAELSPGAAMVKWKHKDEAWKLYGFRAIFSDMSVLVDDEVDADSADPTD